MALKDKTKMAAQLNKNIDFFTPEMSYALSNDIPYQICAQLEHLKKIV